MISNDEIGQTPAEFDHLIDNIFKFVDMNVQKVKKLLLSTYDPTQL